MTTNHERDLDGAIDRAVHDMLDAEPSPALRARVMERLAQPESTFRWMWIALPVAAAAALLIALWLPAPRPLPSRQVTVTASAPQVQGTGNPATVTPRAVSEGSVLMVRHLGNAGRRGAVAPIRLTASSEEWMVPAIGTAALPEMTRIEQSARPDLGDVGPSPLRMKALEITDLPDMPRERRE